MAIHYALVMRSHQISRTAHRIIFCRCAPGQARSRLALSGSGIYLFYYFYYYYTRPMT